MKLKILFCTLIALFFLPAFFGAYAYADAVAEPENSFYISNHSDIEYIRWRSFEVTEDSRLLSSPLSNEENGSIEKGDTVNVGFTYTDDSGVVWGCCSFFGLSDKKDGWVEMSRLNEIYSVYTFIDEHKDELTAYSGELDNYIPKEKVVLWEYPFSDSCVEVKAENWYTKENYPCKGKIASKCWTDENGNVWIYSIRWITTNGGQYDDYWVFLPAPELSDLTNFGYDISANEGTAVSGQLISEEMSAAAEKFAKSSVSGSHSYVLPAVLSIGAVILSAVIIKLMKKKG